MKEQFKRIPLNKIIFSETNPRNNNENEYKDKSLKDLAMSIKANGLIQPVRVRKHPTKTGFYELIVGERRVRAHKIAKLNKVDCIVCSHDDNQVVIAQNIENIQRLDVHALDVARSLRSLLDLVDKKTGNHVYTVDTLAHEIGMSKKYIWETIALVNLNPETAAIFRDKKISKKLAIHIARLTAE